MTAKRTTKILPLLAAITLTGCQVFPPSDIFVSRITLNRPNNPHALFFDGKTYLAQGEPRKAAARFRAALRLQPEFDEARLGLAHAYRESGSCKHAGKVYRKILEKQPNNARALEGLAETEIRLKRPEEAERLLKKALKIDPDSVSTLNALADFYYCRLQYAAALRHWEKSIRLDGDQAHIEALVEDLREYVRKYDKSPLPGRGE